MQLRLQCSLRHLHRRCCRRLLGHSELFRGIARLLPARTDQLQGSRTSRAPAHLIQQVVRFPYCFRLLPAIAGKPNAGSSNFTRAIHLLRIISTTFGVSVSTVPSSALFTLVSCHSGYRECKLHSRSGIDDTGVRLGLAPTIMAMLAEAASDGRDADRINNISQVQELRNITGHIVL